MSAVTKEQLLRAAKVYGLGGDILGDVDKLSGGNKILKFCQFNLAHVTRVDHVHARLIKPSYSLGVSTIAVSDAEASPEEFLDWQKQLTHLQKKSDGTLVGRKKMMRDAEYLKHYFLEGATFAATELNGIPERIFLFSHQPEFDMEKIIERLKAYRLEHPQPRIRDLGFIYANHWH